MKTLSRVGGKILTQRRKGAKFWRALSSFCALAPLRDSYLRLVARSSKQGFILLEAMIAVAVFSIGILALGRCVENCIKAEMVKVEDERARRFLSNRMAEIEQGSVVVQDKATELFKEGEFAGMTLKTTRVPLKKKNEDNKELFGIFSITLELAWKNKGQELSRELNFYVYPRQQQ